MVRLHWHVEDGFSAFIPPGGLNTDKETRVQHAMCEIELAGQSTTIPGLFTLPASYQIDGSTSTVGVILAHGNQAPTYKGRLLNHLAISLAQAGHVVIRYYCAGKEQRRLRLLEKVLDAAVTSPYARNITRWVMAGIGSGARVCASVGTRCRANIAGYLLMAYPLQEPVSVFKGPMAPDSSGPLLKLNSPVLFVHPEKDALATTEQLTEISSKIPAWDVRLVEVAGVDGYFRDAESHAPPTEEVRKRLADIALQFTGALANGSLSECNDTLPTIRDPSVQPPQPPPPPPTLRPPLVYPPYHLFEQQAMRMQGGGRTVQQLPQQLLSLLVLAQQYHQQQEQLVAQALPSATVAGAGAAMEGVEGVQGLNNGAHHEGEQPEDGPANEGGAMQTVDAAGEELVQQEMTGGGQGTLEDGPDSKRLRTE